MTQTDAPILLPDGSVFPAGSVTFCGSIRLSPVSSLHRVYVNGQPVGFLRSRVRTRGGRADTATVVVFESDAKGRLALSGYVVPVARGSVTYLFGEDQGPRARDAVATATGAGSGTGPGSTVVLLATAQ